jgi:hypothetical protein
VDRGILWKLEVAHGQQKSLTSVSKPALGPISYTMGTGGKARPGRGADHWPPSSAEVENE